MAIHNPEPSGKSALRQTLIFLFVAAAGIAAVFGVRRLNEGPVAAPALKRELPAPAVAADEYLYFACKHRQGADSRTENFKKRSSC